MRNRVALILIIVLVIASTGAGYFFGAANQRTVTLIPSSSTVGGLELRASLNATHLNPNQELRINVSLFNTLSSPFNLSASRNWRVPGFPIAMWSTCLYPDPVEFMIVRGNFSLAELQMASANSSAYGGGCMEGGTITHLLFQPNSSMAELAGSYCIANCSAYHTSARLASIFTVKGYWTYPMNATEANDVYTPVDGGVSFQYPEIAPVHAHGFIHGTYTLVVSDEWGQTDIIHFSVD